MAGEPRWGGGGQLCDVGRVLRLASLTDECAAVAAAAAELFDGVMRFNNILIDFDRDLWAYIRCAGVVAGLCAVAADGRGPTILGAPTHTGSTHRPTDPAHPHPHPPTCARAAWATSSSARSRARSGPPPCPTRSTPSTLRTARATWASPTPRWATWPPSCRSRAGSATSPTRPCCATWAWAWGTRCWPTAPRCAACPSCSLTPGASPVTSMPPGRCSPSPSRP